MEEVKQYIKDNLKVHIHYIENNTIEMYLTLEDEIISKDFIHYRIKQ